MNKKYKYLIVILVVIICVIVGFFIFKKATPKNETFLTLNGNTDVILYQNDAYSDPGYDAYDSKGKDLTSNVTVRGIVDTATAGDYVVTYTLNDIVKERHITVIAKIVQKTYLILKGESTIFLKVGEEYKEPGYTVIDAIESGLENKVNVSGNVGTTAGTYKLKYSVTNKSEETISAERTIIIMDSDIGISYTPEKKTNGNVKIILNVIDNYYDYIVLPDNTKKNERYIAYEVSENGTYKFTIYSKNGEAKEKDITINNIYRVPPSGTCEYYLYDTYGEIKVNTSASDLNYVYKYDNSTSSKLTEKTFKVNDLSENAKVILHDEAGNTSEITCQNIDKSTKIPSSYTTYRHKGGDKETTFSYWLYLPKDNNKRKKIPLLLYFHGDSGKGTNPASVNENAFPKFISKGMDFPFAMVAPQVNWGDSFYNTYYQNGVYNLLKELINEYNIDPDRIIVSGGSSGADGAYRAIALHSEMFSCGVIGSGTIYAIDQVGADKLTKIPLWFFHGEKDAVLAHTAMERRIDKIRSLGGNVKYTLIENGTHNITETVFKRDDLINWMISQKRK